MALYKDLLLLLLIGVVILSGCTTQQSVKYVCPDSSIVDGPYLCPKPATTTQTTAETLKCVGDACADNGVCERGEIETCDPDYEGWIGPQEGGAMCCPNQGHPVANKIIESNDCPKTCDDGNSNTGDYYNFTAQRCEHYECEKLTITLPTSTTISSTIPTRENTDQITKLREYHNTSYNAEITLYVYKVTGYSSPTDFLMKLMITNNNDVEIPQVSGPSVCILEGPSKGSVCSGGLSSETGFTRFYWNHIPAKTTIEGWNLICGIDVLKSEGTKFAYCISLNNSLIYFETDLSELGS